MTRADAPLPTLPLWAAALMALSAEAALLAALSQWPAPQRPAPPAVPIEVRLVPAPALADSAAGGAAGGLIDAPAPAIVPEPLPERGPEPKPEQPQVPELAPQPAPEPEPERSPEPQAVTPVPVRAPDPVAERVAPVQAKPKPRPISKPKPKPKLKPNPKPNPKPKAPAQPKTRAEPKAAPKPTLASKPASGVASVRPSAAAVGATSRHAPAADKAAATSGDSSPAAYLSNPRPGYPDVARRQRQEGTVQLRVLVLPNGSVSEAHISGSSGVSSLDQAALRAVRRWRFKPARQNGRPISAWVRVPIRFQLDR